MCSKWVKNLKVKKEIVKVVEDMWELLYYPGMEKSFQLLYKMKKPEEKKNNSLYVFKKISLQKCLKQSQKINDPWRNICNLSQKKG